MMMFLLFRYRLSLVNYVDVRVLLEWGLGLPVSFGLSFSSVDVFRLYIVVIVVTITLMMDIVIVVIVIVIIIP